MNEEKGLPGWDATAQKLLGEYPLYRWVPLKRPGLSANISVPRPQLICPRCRAERTYVLQAIDKKASGDFIVYVGTSWLTYACASCNQKTEFLVEFGASQARKVGQVPAWSINIPASVEKFLDTDGAELYKRGKICESQGFGIGAFAYYRRAVEMITSKLLESIKEILTDKERTEYESALVAIERETVAEKKMELVKDLLPDSLRPGGINPLDLLHGVLSGGLHEETEEECLEIADAVRNSLEYLIDEVAVRKKSVERLTDSMKRLLNKRQQKGN